MVVSIFANPGQKITLAIEVKDGYGALADGYQEPVVDFLRLPSGQSASGYPIIMEEISQGIWIYDFFLPSGSGSTGSYIASISWPAPYTDIFQNELFLINVALPFGNSSVAPG